MSSCWNREWWRSKSRWLWSVWCTTCLNNVSHPRSGQLAQLTGWHQDNTRQHTQWTWQITGHTHILNTTFSIFSMTCSRLTRFLSRLTGCTWFTSQYAGYTISTKEKAGNTTNKKNINCVGFVNKSTWNNFCQHNITWFTWLFNDHWTWCTEPSRFLNRVIHKIQSCTSCVQLGPLLNRTYLVWDSATIYNPSL